MLNYSKGTAVGLLPLSLSVFAQSRAKAVECKSKESETLFIHVSLNGDPINQLMARVMEY